MPPVEHEPSVTAYNTVPNTGSLSQFICPDSSHPILGSSQNTSERDLGSPPMHIRGGKEREDLESCKAIG